MGLSLKLGLDLGQQSVGDVELVTNSDFGSAEGWTLTANASISGGQLTIVDRDPSEESADQPNIPLTVGDWYLLEIDIASTNYSSTLYMNRGFSGFWILSKVPGVQTRVFQAVSNGVRIAHGGASGTGTTVVNYISLKRTSAP